MDSKNIEIQQKRTKGYAVDVTETFKITATENSVKVDITWDDSSYPTGSAVAAYVDITEGINYIAIVGETATATFAIKYIPKKVITINNSVKLI